MNKAIKPVSHRDQFLVAMWIVLMWVVAFMLGGCAEFPAWGGWSATPSSGQLEAAVRGPARAYTYYPEYEVYYDHTLEQYVYRTPGGWVERSSPPDTVTEDTLRVSPSVEISLPGDPSVHHATVSQAHPGRSGIPAVQEVRGQP